MIQYTDCIVKVLRDVSGYLSQVQGHGCDRGEALLQSDSAGMFRHSDSGEDGIPVEKLLVASGQVT